MCKILKEASEYDQLVVTNLGSFEVMSRNCDIMADRHSDKLLQGGDQAKGN